MNQHLYNREQEKVSICKFSAFTCSYCALHYHDYLLCMLITVIDTINALDWLTDSELKDSWRIYLRLTMETDQSDTQNLELCTERQKKNCTNHSVYIDPVIEDRRCGSDVNCCWRLFIFHSNRIKMLRLLMLMMRLQLLRLVEEWFCHNGNNKLERLRPIDLMERDSCVTIHTHRSTQRDRGRVQQLTGWIGRTIGTP